MVIVYAEVETKLWVEMGASEETCWDTKKIFFLPNTVKRFKANDNPFGSPNFKIWKKWLKL